MEDNGQNQDFGSSIEEQIETIEDNTDINEKIFMLQSMIDQMKRMIEENLREIELGNDAKARANMILVLSSEMNNAARELEELKATL